MSDPERTELMKIAPQEIDDSAVSGLILTFTEGGLTVESLALPHMNRDFSFGEDGLMNGTGTFLGHEDIDPGELRITG